nr:MAG TPA: hypothetical protein [Caudoviricetes sp.]
MVRDSRCQEMSIRQGITTLYQCYHCRKGTCMEISM